MKTCPKCNKGFKQLKKGACPSCGTALFYSKGIARRESDKVLATKMREKAKPLIEKNLGVGGYMMLHQEQVYAYRFIDTLRFWLNSQPIKLLSTDDMAMKVLDAFLTDEKYWKKNLRSLAGPAKQCVQVAMVIYRDMKIQEAKATVQEQRVINANINNLHVSYE